MKVKPNLIENQYMTLLRIRIFKKNRRITFVLIIDYNSLFCYHDIGITVF
jgi:hypothetical protein